MRLGLTVALLAVGCSSVPVALEGKPTANFPVSWDGKMTKQHAAKLRKEQKAADAADVDRVAFENASEADSVKLYVSYLRRFPAGAYRLDAQRRALAAIERQEDDQRDDGYERLVESDPPSLQALPVRPRMLLTGPVGMRIKDIVALQAQGVGNKIIESKIRAAAQPYGDFSAAELGVLTELGIDQEVIAAMIDMTAQARKERRDQSEREALRLEIAELRRLVKEQQAKASEGSGESSAPKTVQTRDGMMDVAKCIAAKLAAKEGCGRLPWPGSTVCSTSLQAAYPCN